MSPPRRSRFYAAALVLGAVAFYAGTRLVPGRPAPHFHPLSGRQIAGIATDAGWLDRTARQQEEAPDQALALIGVHAGMTVADIGAGSGYMTMRLAKLVAPGGMVYANDVQPAMLRVIGDKVAQEGINNVVLVPGTETEAHLPDGTIELALLVDVYHELAQPQAMLRSIRRSLTADGRLVLVEYRKEDAGIPIAPTHRMSLTEARMEVEAEGFRFERAIEGLPRQHVLVFRR